MNGNRVIKEPDPLLNQDVLTKRYVDMNSATKVSKNGETMHGMFNMGSNKIASVVDPTDVQDAVTKNI